MKTIYDSNVWLRLYNVESHPLATKTPDFHTALSDLRRGPGFGWSPALLVKHNRLQSKLPRTNTRYAEPRGAHTEPSKHLDLYRGIVRSHLDDVPDGGLLVNIGKNLDFGQLVEGMKHVEYRRRDARAY